MKEQDRGTRYQQIRRARELVQRQDALNPTVRDYLDVGRKLADPKLPKDERHGLQIAQMAYLDRIMGSPLQKELTDFLEFEMEHLKKKLGR